MLMDRRQFLQSLGLIGAGGLASCQAPTERLYAYLTPPRETVPGVAAYFATVCRACPAGCGILVKTREARPIKLEGNPLHPVNRGALCARGQAFVQGLYSRHRVRSPLVRRDGRLQEASWSDAMAAVLAQLGSAKAVGLLTGLESGAFEDVAADVLGGFAEGIHLQYEPLSLRPLAKAGQLLLGLEEVPFIDLLPPGTPAEAPRRGPAHYLLSLGADVLDGWLSPVQHARQWSDAHGLGADRSARLDYLGARRNLTANAADRWLRVSPRELGPIALDLLRALFDKKHRYLPADEAEQIQAVIGRLSGAAAPPTTLPAGERERILGELERASVATVLWGGADVMGEDATSVAAAVVALNRLTGALGKTVRFGEGYAYSKLAADVRVMELIDRAAAGALDALVLAGTNPAYTLPGAFDAPSKLRRSTFVVVMAHEFDETTDFGDVVLPIHHPLESWGDYEVTSTVAGLMQPVRVPLYDSRPAGDVLLELGRGLGRPGRFGSLKQYVVERWARRAGPGTRTEGSDVLDETLVAGGQFAAGSGTLGVLTADPETLSVLRPLGHSAREEGKVELLAPMSAALYDGRAAGCDWLLETPDSLQQTVWEVPLELASDVAAAAGVAPGDTVELETAHGKTTAVALLDDELGPGTAAYRMGGGRPFTRELVAGGNVMRLLGAATDPVSGQLVRVATTATVRRLASRGLALATGSASSEGRYLCLAMTLGDVRAGRYPRMTTHGEEYPDENGHFGRGHAVPMPHQEIPLEDSRPEENIIPLARHPVHRWGLVVDLDRCTGCAACVVACYAENNIPCVGRDEVNKGRSLAWIRIERHVFGSGPARQVRFLPVMCQQCSQAPCESVCPVFAPHHTADGLNAQIYNRCVGTRFCANNCPYKVRRFNFFDYPRERPATEQLNPDVTVRSRGVMEKCTFCIQRIREVTNRAKAEGRPVRDGEIKPACVQTCPTGALSFGDFKRPEWAATGRARDPRGYRLLDYKVNTRPGVVYLRKVFTDPVEVKG